MNVGLTPPVIPVGISVPTIPPPIQSVVDVACNPLLPWQTPIRNANCLPSDLAESFMHHLTPIRIDCQLVPITNGLIISSYPSWIRLSPMYLSLIQAISVDEGVAGPACACVDCYVACDAASSVLLKGFIWITSRSSRQIDNYGSV